MISTARVQEPRAERGAHLQADADIFARVCRLRCEPPSRVAISVVRCAETLGHQIELHVEREQTAIRRWVVPAEGVPRILDLRFRETLSLRTRRCTGMTRTRSRGEPDQRETCEATAGVWKRT
jgi:hypothetical protein